MTHVPNCEVNRLDIQLCDVAHYRAMRNAASHFHKPLQFNNLALSPSHAHCIVVTATNGHKRRRNEYKLLKSLIFCLNNWTEYMAFTAFTALYRR